MVWVAVGLGGVAGILAGNTPPQPWSCMLVRTFPNQTTTRVCAGDFNGDGFSDVAMGGPREEANRGRVLVFLGRREGLAAEPQWVLDGTRPEQRLGACVAAADVNGDRITDLVVTEWTARAKGERDEAVVHLFFGATHGLPASPSQTLPGAVGRFGLHFVMARAGDVNGDRLEDLAVAAVELANPEEGVTWLLVFHGSRVGLQPQPAWSWQREQYGSGFGARFGAAGDVNGDGFGDLFLGASRHTGRFQFGGKAYVFHGSTTGLGQQPAWTSEYPLRPDHGLESNLFFGAAMDGAGNVNGDPYDDLAVGAWNGSHGDRYEGLAFVFDGSKTGLAAAPSWIAEGEQTHALLGRAVGGAGDVNGDGLGDVVVGVPFASHGEKDEGVVLVHYGSRHGLGSEPDWTFDGDLPNGHLGDYVGTAGDVNGDGVADLLMAGADTAEPEEPRLRVVVVYGRQGGLPNSSGWSSRRSLLAATLHRLDRMPATARWSAAVAALAMAVGALAWVQFRLRRQLARVIAENRALAATEERTRIARDMHDHLGADLTRLATHLDRTAEMANWTALQKLRDSAQEAVKTLDELVWATNPEQDTLEGLANYLAEFAPGFLETHGVGCELELPAQLPPVALPASARHNLLRIAKEALRNVVQHAGASKVRVALGMTDHSLQLTVEDDGRGMAWGQSTAEPAVTDGAGNAVGERATGGNGLRNMRARAEALKGEFAVTRIQPHGTKVCVTVPLARLRARAGQT